MEIIIFEGTDNSGKTTIAKGLCELMGYEYFRNPRQHEYFKNKDFTNWLKYDVQLILNLCKQFKKSQNIRGIIFDRSIPSEYVYSKTFKRATDEDLIWRYDEEFAKLDAKIIYCNKQYGDKFEDPLICIDDISNLKLNYEKYFEKSKIKKIEINTTDENIDKQLIKISEFIWRN